MLPVKISHPLLPNVLSFFILLKPAIPTNENQGIQ